MNCYNCGAPLSPGMRSCPKCKLDFPLPVPGPGGQTEVFVQSGQPKPIINDSVRGQLFRQWSPRFIIRLVVFAILAVRSLMAMYGHHQQPASYSASSTSSGASAPNDGSSR